MLLSDDEIRKIKYHFGILGISPTNNRELIELTYYKLFNIYHPDRSLNKDEYNFNFKKVSELNESKEFCLKYCQITDLIQQISNYDNRESDNVLNRKNFWARIWFIVSSLRSSIKEWIKVKEERAKLRFVDLGFKKRTNFPFPTEHSKPSLSNKLIDLCWIAPISILIILNFIYILPFSYLILTVLFYKIVFLHLFNSLRKKYTYYEDKPISLNPIYLIPSSILSILIILFLGFTYSSVKTFYGNIVSNTGLVLSTTNKELPYKSKIITKEIKSNNTNAFENKDNKNLESEKNENKTVSPDLTTINLDIVKYINAEDGTKVKKKPLATAQTINILPHGTKITIQESEVTSDYIYCIECNGYVYKNILSDSKPNKNRKYKLIKERDNIYYYQIADKIANEFYELSNNEVFYHKNDELGLGTYVIDNGLIKIEVNGVNKKYKYIGKIGYRNKFSETEE